jgi:hypothetical protein
MTALWLSVVNGKIAEGITIRGESKDVLGRVPRSDYDWTADTNARAEFERGIGRAGSD